MEFINPPLKIQGKKTKLVPDIKALAEELIDSNPNIDTWIEPFFGTGVVGFNCPDRIKKVICADINPYIIEFYKNIQAGYLTSKYVKPWLYTMSEQLCERGNEFYLETRNDFNKTKDISLFFFLSRTCFNGMMRFNKKGEWNLPFCKDPNKLSEKLINKLCDEIDCLYELMQKKEFVFLCQSYEETLKLANENSIIYCDPPYYGLNSTYYEKWGREFEIDLANELKKYPSSRMISTWKFNGVQNNEMIDQYWGDYKIKLIEHQYIVGPKKENRPKVIEALLYK